MAGAVSRVEPESANTSTLDGRSVLDYQAGGSWGSGSERDWFRINLRQDSGYYLDLGGMAGGQGDLLKTQLSLHANASPTVSSELGGGGHLSFIPSQDLTSYLAPESSAQSPEESCQITQGQTGSAQTGDSFFFSAKDLANGGVSYEVGYVENDVYSAGFYLSSTYDATAQAGETQMSVGDGYSVSYTPNDTYYGSQYALTNIGVPTAWDYQAGGRSDVKVAVIDTGVTVTGDLSSTRFDTADSWDFVNNDSTVTDGHGHGTFVTSEIAAGTNNSQGISGIAYGVTVIEYKALDDSGSGTDTAVANAINQAVNAGADIISMSLGGGYSSIIAAACQNAYNHGVLVVAAAGNDGSSSLSYPAGYSTVLAVGSTTSSNTLSSFSNHASNMVVAPGSSILGMTNSGSYQYWSGTSMATPEVAALAALILSEAKDLNLSSLPGKNSSRVDWLRSVLTSTVTDLGSTGQDSTYGYGKVNAASALASLQTGGSGTSDDYAAGTGTSGGLSVGSSVYGNIGTSGDNDWFRLTLTAGTNYQFDLEGSATSQGTLSDPYLYLYSSAGSLLASANDGGTGANSRLTFRAATSGVYYLDAAANGTGTGTYKLSASRGDDYAGATSTTGSLSAGGSLTGTLETLGDRDWFKVSLTAGSYYYFDLKGASTSSGTLTDPYLYLYNSAGSLLTYNDDGGSGYNSRITYSASSSGVYYLGAGAYGDYYTGTYLLSAGTFSDDYTSSTNTGGSLSAGGSATGSINYAGDSDWFRLSLSAGNSYYLRVQGSSSSSGTLADPYLTLYNSAGSALASADNGGTGYDSLLTYTPASNGTYYLAASSTSASATGTYRVSLEADDYAASTKTAGVVSVGGSITGKVQANGDSDWFAVSLASGWAYQLDLEGSATGKGTLADPYLYLYNNSGTLLSSANDGGTGANSRLAYNPASAGTYYLGAAANGSGTGTYKLSVTKLTDDYASNTTTTGNLGVGGSLAGTINYSGDGDWFKLSLNAGATYYLNVKGASSSSGTLTNPYLTLYNGSGASVGAADNGGIGNDSLLSYTPTSSGTYYLAASSGTVGGTGTYNVSVGQDDYAGSTSTSGLLSVPTDTTRVYQTGTLTVAGDRDWFKVNMQSGFSFHFDAEGQDTGKGTLSDPYLYLYNSAGTLLLSADGGGTGKNAHLDYNATVTGTYYVGVGASGDNQTGTYRLTGWDPPTDQDSSGLSSAMSATLSQLSSTSGSAALTQGLSSSSSGSAADAASGSPLTSSSGSALAGALSTSASGGSTTTATATSTDSSSPAASGTTSASSSGSSSASSASSLASPVTSAAAAGAASSATAASANVLAAAAPTTTPSLTSGSSSTLASGLLAAAH